MRKIRPLIIGKDAAGKSTFVGTGPKPMLVLLHDAPDKAHEYLKRGVAGELERTDLCYFQNVFSVKDAGKLLIRIEYWGEPTPTEPTAYGRFLSRLFGLEREIVEKGWQTVVLDSVTSLEMSARYYSEYNINKDVRDGRQHYSYSMKACEQIVMTRWPNLINTNAIVIAHYDEFQDDSEDGEKTVTRKAISVPGKLASRIGTQFSEVWRVYVDDEGNRRLQTTARPRNTFNCKSSIGVPDYSYPHWKSVEAVLGEAPKVQPIEPKEVPNEKENV